MKFNLIRIDDRLIHGQVALGWTRAKGIDTIVAVDDKVAKDGLQCSLLHMATPPGVKSYIVSVADAVTLIQSGKLDKKHIMLLSKGPEALIQMIDAGVELDEEEIKVWTVLAEKTKLIAQILPDSPKVNFNELLDKVSL